jgi:hypothetical protein
MGTSDAYDCNRRSRRRDENKRRRVEVAVERLRLPPEVGQALSAGIYGLYRNLVAQNLLTIKIGIFANGRVARSISLRNGPRLHPVPTPILHRM